MQVHTEPEAYNRDLQQEMRASPCLRMKRVGKAETECDAEGKSDRRCDEAARCQNQTKEENNLGHKYSFRQRLGASPSSKTDAT